MRCNAAASAHSSKGLLNASQTAIGADFVSFVPQISWSLPRLAYVSAIAAQVQELQCCRYAHFSTQDARTDTLSEIGGVPFDQSSIPV